MMDRDRWPIFVINLERSTDRWENIQRAFHEDSLTRISGVDGRKWESGEYHMNGRPVFKDGIVETLVESKIFSPKSTSMFPWVPCEVGCALSHMKVWRRIIEDEIPWSIVLEDDAEPTDGVIGGLQASLLREFPLPDDAEVVFLHGADTPHKAIVIDDNNRLLGGFGNVGYAISLEGAKRAVKASLPMYYPCDFQWWTRAFKGLRMFSFVPDDPIEKGQAYAMRKSLVKFGMDNNRSTFTASGDKPWKRLPYENSLKRNR